MLLPLHSVGEEKKMSRVGAPYRFVKRMYFFCSVAAYFFRLFTCFRAALLEWRCLGRWGLATPQAPSALAVYFFSSFFEQQCNDNLCAL